MSVIWEDPPEKQRGNGGKGRAGVNWLAVVEELRSRPGEWGRVATCPRAGTKAAALARLIRGGLAPFTVGEFEATSRQVGDEGRVYARYVGPGSTSPEPGPECSGCADHPRPCPAHGDHPHGGRRCLDCPECPQPMRLGDAFPELRAESTKDGTE